MSGPYGIDVEGLALQGIPSKSFHPLCLPMVLQQVDWPKHSWPQHVEWPMFSWLSTLRLVDLNLDNWSQDVSGHQEADLEIDMSAVKHLELRRCQDKSFLQWLHTLNDTQFMPRKFIYVMREKQDPAPWDHWSQRDHRGLYYEECRAVLGLASRSLRSRPECLGMHFPPNLGYQQIQEIHAALSSGSLFPPRCLRSAMREMVVIVGDSILQPEHIDGVARLCRNLRDPQGMGKVSSWPRLYDDPVVGDDDWSCMGTGPAQFWSTRDAGNRMYHGRSFTEES